MFDLYKKTTVGDAYTYVRPYQTISLGPLGGQNSLTVFEEKITVLSDASTARSDLGTPEIVHVVTDPDEAFNLIHPVTGAVTGSMTFAQLKVQMYSLYLHMAGLRDDELAAEEAARLAAP